ncbi:hypothetical protein [Streptomyces sp. NPDC050504]|uniref:hypothetical protein n=1 Tax=Streptomyces sp. NPDC050504 TaxID=3365618 RepID=UPI0037927ACB
MASALAESAVELAGGGDASEDVLPCFTCELGDKHAGADHAALVLFLPGPSGRAVWVRWQRFDPRLSVVDPCVGEESGGDVCLLFAGHPGGHLWPEDIDPVRDGRGLP